MSKGYNTQSLFKPEALRLVKELYALGNPYKGQIRAARRQIKLVLGDIELLRFIWVKAEGNWNTAPIYVPQANEVGAYLRLIKLGLLVKQPSAVGNHTWFKMSVTPAGSRALRARGLI